MTQTGLATGSTGSTAGNTARALSVASILPKMHSSELDTMKANQRPGTVKIIPTTTPVSCFEEFQMLSLPTRLNNVGKILAKKQDMDIQKACAAGYEPSKKDVVVRDTNVKAANLFRCPSFRRLVRENCTFYMVPSTYVERRKVALRVMQAVQGQGGLFLESSGSQQWCLVSPGAVERFVAGVLEQEARARGAARAVRATQSVRVPVKVAPTQAQGPPISILLQRYPVAPSRPVARSKKNKTLLKQTPLAPCPASGKSLLAKTAATTTLKAPHRMLKRRSSKKFPLAARLHQTAGHNGQIGTPMLWDDADVPRRVSCDKEVAAAQQEAQHEDQQFQLLQTQHQQKRRLPPVNPLDLLSATAIWDNAAAAAFAKSPPPLKKRKHVMLPPPRTPPQQQQSLLNKSKLQQELQFQHQLHVYRIRTLDDGYNEHAVNDQLSYIWN